MSDTIIITGKIQQGGVAISETRQYKQFCVDNDGNYISITIQKLEKEPSKAMIAYFRKVVVPEFAMLFYHKYGERYPMKNVESMILELCETAKKHSLVNGEHKKQTVPLGLMSQQRLQKVIEEAGQIAAEHFDATMPNYPHKNKKNETKP